MTTTREKIEIMEAYKRGEKIQIYGAIPNKWTDMNIEPLWDWTNFNYRVKSKFHDGDILFLEAANSWIFIFKENENKESIYNYHFVDSRSVCYRLFN